MQTIDFDQTLQLQSKILVDVRSPKEFAEDHPFGAINIPLLDNEERAIIGTLYKHEGKERAVEKGYEYVNPKLEALERRLRELAESYEYVVLYCFRGGMRSTSVVEFAQSKGISVYKLKDGYRGYRSYVLEYLQSMEKRFRFVVLHGNTCVGKTDLLLEIQKRGCQILDLEYLAKNSGSVFGEIYYDGNAPTQKYFESQMFAQLHAFEQAGDPFVFMESESRKIGRCYLSKEFWAMMQNGLHILVQASIEARVKRSVYDYSVRTRETDDALIGSVQKLKDTLGSHVVSELIAEIKEKNYAYVAQYLMEEYYDRLYRHSEKKYQYEFTVNTDEMEAAAERITQWHTQILLHKEA